eukprot:scaffold61969_cov18-Tisochrysis_lutea.AAC.1
MEGANKVPPDGKFSEVPGVVPTPIQLEEEQGTAGVHAGTTRVGECLLLAFACCALPSASYDGPLDFVNGDGSASERLVVVANRLPVTCSKDQHGHWQLQVSAGGLVSALKGVSTYTTMWIGWPGKQHVFSSGVRFHGNNSWGYFCERGTLSTWWWYASLRALHV